MAFPNPAAGCPTARPWNRPQIPGIGYEVGLMFALLAVTADSRARNWVRRLALVLFAAFLPFSLYHEAYVHSFYRDAAVVDDWRLLANLGAYLNDSHGWRFAAEALVTYVAGLALTAWAFRRVQRWAETVPRKRRAIGAAAFAIAGGAFVLLVRDPPANAIVQPLSDTVRVNWQASRVALANRHAIYDVPPDRRYDDFAALPMLRRPNVYFLMIEAYGEVLATCESQTAYRDLLDRIETRLTAGGFHARSGYSIAPVHGGRSWLSMATAQTGIRIDAEPAFRLLQQEAARLPTLTRFFKAHGYHTSMLESGVRHRVGLPNEDIYQRDRTVTHDDIGYAGPYYGLSGVPDQYSLEYFRHRVLAGSPEPRFVFYMAASTHYYWVDCPPFVREWWRLDYPPVEYEDLVPWQPVRGRDKMPPGGRLWLYFDDIEYEWRALADFIESRRDEDALIVVLGDHQPLLTCGNVVNDDTPMHVLSRDAELVDRFADAGLEPGLYAEPGRKPPLKHEGLFSLLAAKLAGAPRYPDGIGLSGLRR